MNKDLLNNWISNGYASEDLGDGSWGWTDIGETVIPDEVRTLLSMLLYHDKLPRHLSSALERAGFDRDGFVITDGC